MEFPSLFDFIPEPEPAPKARPAREPEEEKEGEASGATALVPVAGPLNPVREVIQDIEVLRRVLDERGDQPLTMLGEELLSQGYINVEQLERAIRIQQKHGGKTRIGEILVSTGAITQELLDFILARRLGVPSVNLRRLKISSSAVRLVPKILASKYTLMPCLIHRNQIVVAMENPMDQNALKALRFACERHILTVKASRLDIEWAIPQYYKDIRNYKGPADQWL